MCDLVWRFSYCFCFDKNCTVGGTQRFQVLFMNRELWRASLQLRNFYANEGNETKYILYVRDVY